MRPSNLINNSSMKIADLPEHTFQFNLNEIEGEDHDEPSC